VRGFGGGDGGEKGGGRNLEMLGHDSLSPGGGRKSNVDGGVRGGVERERQNDEFDGIGGGFGGNFRGDGRAEVTALEYIVMCCNTL